MSNDPYDDKLNKLNQSIPGGITDPELFEQHAAAVKLLAQDYAAGKSEAVAEINRRIYEEDCSGPLLDDEGNPIIF